MKTIYNAMIYFSHLDGDGTVNVLVETDGSEGYFGAETSRKVLQAAIDQFFRGGGMGAVTCVSISRFSGEFVSLVQ